MEFTIFASESLDHGISICKYSIDILPVLGFNWSEQPCSEDSPQHREFFHILPVPDYIEAESKKAVLRQSKSVSLVGAMFENLTTPDLILVSEQIESDRNTGTIHSLYTESLKGLISENVRSGI